MYLNINYMNHELGPVEMPVREELGVKQKYAHNPNELRQRHTIEIEFLSVGCTVRVGCKKLAFTNYEDALKEIIDYVNDPVESYRIWGKKLNVELL